MWDLFFYFVAAAAGTSSTSDVPAVVAAAVEPAAQSALVAEDQTPTGKFTTAAEVKPIIAMTTGNWIAVREWDGQDLVYVSHVWAWRCGLAQMEVSVNGASPEIWPLPPCHVDTNQPNAITESDGLPYRSFALQSVQTLTVKLTFDDLTSQIESFDRKAVLMP